MRLPTTLIVFGILTVLVSLITNTPAYAESCEQNFAVDSSKSLVSDEWLPPSGTASQFDGMSCTAAELMRERLFIDLSNVVDLAQLGKYEVWQESVEQRISKYEATLNQLNEELSAGATLSALKIAADTLLWVASTTFTMASCVAPEPTISKVECFIGTVGIYKGVYDLVSGATNKSDIEQARNEITGKYALVKSLYNEIVANNPGGSMTPAQQRYKQLYDGLCAAIQKNCL